LALFELLNKGQLTWHQKHKSVSFGFVSGCASHSMNVRAYILRNIYLNNPVNSWKINTSGCDVSTQQNSLFLFHKLKVYCSAFVLVLLTV